MDARPAGQAGIRLDDYSLKLAELYQAECATRSNIWTVYVVATFAAGGFVVTAAHEVSSLARLALSVGFLAFTAGHWFLLARNTSMLIALEGLLREALGQSGDVDGQRNAAAEQFRDRLARRTNAVLPFVPHLIIDCCVLLVIWVKYLERLFGFVTT